ncbi:hypothetical protein ACQKWADRAFT_284002 [Trichoderma austrokoningii]
MATMQCFVLLSRWPSSLELCSPLIDPLASWAREKRPSIVGIIACTCSELLPLVNKLAGLLAFRYLSRALVRWLLEVASPRPPSLETFITAPRPPLLTFFSHLTLNLSFYTEQTERHKKCT